MACPKDDILFIYDNSFINDWVEKFYVSIVEANFLTSLNKYQKVFDLFSIILDIAKFNIHLNKNSLLNKFHTIEMRWRGNELSIKKLEFELRKILFELKEENMEYKIIILLSEIKHLCKNNIDLQKNEFYNFTNEVIKKIESNILPSYEKKIVINQLENFLYLLSKNH